MSDTINLRCWEIKGTAAALCISMLPKDRAPNATGIWIPKSMLEHISRTPAKVNEWTELSITLPEWFAEKKGLI